MVKIFFVCRRREGLAVSDYRQMVLREHVPLALEHHRTMLRYEINLVAAVPPGAPGGAPRDPPGAPFSHFT